MEAYTREHSRAFFSVFLSLSTSSPVLCHLFYLLSFSHVYMDVCVLCVDLFSACASTLNKERSTESKKKCQATVEEKNETHTHERKNRTSKTKKDKNIAPLLFCWIIIFIWCVCVSWALSASYAEKSCVSRRPPPQCARPTKELRKRTRRNEKSIALTRFIVLLYTMQCTNMHAHIKKKNEEKKERKTKTQPTTKKYCVYSFHNERTQKKYTQQFFSPSSLSLTHPVYC